MPPSRLDRLGCTLLVLGLLVLGWLAFQRLNSKLSALVVPIESAGAIEQAK